MAANIGVKFGEWGISLTCTKIATNKIGYI